MMIELSGVHFAHARRPDVLTSIDLRVDAGEVVLVEATPGAGASTLVRLLLGELPARGRVAIDGRDVTRLRARSLAALRRRLGIVPQELGLVARDTALANVALALEVCGVRSTARLAQARALLAEVGVDGALPVERLAMAARQRVAWARALVREPDAVIADQPTAHQDADGAARFAALLGERAEAGAACLVLTRDPHLVAAGARLGWRTHALHAGVLADAAPSSIAVATRSGPVPQVILDATDAIESSEPILGAVAQAAVDGDRSVEIEIDVEPSAPIALPTIVPARATAGSIDVPDIAPVTPLPDVAAEPPTDEELAAIPNVVPFPRARSAGTRR